MKIGYEVRESNVIQNTLTTGWQHRELTIGNTATKITDIPMGCKMVAIHNDSGVDLRYGGSNVEWEAAASNTNPNRGFPMLNGRAISMGVCDAEEFYLVADAAGRKIVVLFGI